MNKYEPVPNSPVARLWYKGTHSHPVRRTVMIVSEDRQKIVGYELREGSIVRRFQDAPIKTYRRDRIAKIESLRSENPVRKAGRKGSTLVRSDLLDIITSGV